MTVDSSQFAFDDLPLIDTLLQMSVHDMDGVLDLFNVLVDFVLLHRERLLDADQVEGVSADGIDRLGKKNIPFLSKKLDGYGC